MTKQYIVEKGCTLPLCCIDNDVYFDYLTGQVIDNENVLIFIKDGLERKALEIKKLDLVIYEIKEYINIALKEMKACRQEDSYYDWDIVAYKYVINGYSNYLSENKQPLNNNKRQYIIDKLMKGEYVQVKIWE